MDHLRVLVVDEGHPASHHLAEALAAGADGVEVVRAASILDAEAACGTTDVVVVAADRFDAAWVAARHVCGSVVVATANAKAANTVAAGVHAVLVLPETPAGPGGVDADFGAVKAQAALIWRQLKAGQGRVLSLTDEVSARRENFLGHVSHELRTPLTAVYGTLEILTEQLYDGLPQPLQECLEISLRNCAQLRRMVDDLLDAASADRGRTRVDPERMSPADLLRDPIADAVTKAGERDSRVSVDVADDLPDVLADPSRARKIVDHLIDNAIKFSPEGSAIRITADASHADSLVIVSVSDDGPGIDPAIAAALFDPLRQSVDELRSSRRGLGLGLYLCKRLVEAHGGRIWAESNAEGGTTFRFTLPSYTLEHMVAALAPPGKDGPPTVSCVVIEVPATKAAPDIDRHEDTTRLVRSAIRDRDLVATGFPGVAVPELVGVLAACDEGGAAAIEARLRVRLASEQGRSLRAGGSGPRIVRVTVAADPGERTPPAEELARRIRTGLEQLLSLPELAVYEDAPALSQATRGASAHSRSRS